MAKLVKENVEDMSKHFHYYPKIAPLLTAHSKGRDNIMPAAWTTPISVIPPLYGVTVSPKRFTYKLIAESKEFGINFLPFEMAKLAAAAGGSSGYDTDKFKKFNIAKEKSVKTSVPILKDAYAAFECQLIDDREYGDHHWLVGKVVAIHWEKKVFQANDLLDMKKVSPLLYMGRDTYLTAATDSVKVLDREIYSKGI